MGEISIAFDHIADKKQVRELSVVLYTDSFFYGLWDEDDQLVLADSGKLEQLKDLFLRYSESYDLKITRIMSTVKPYVHLPAEEFESQYFDAYFKGVYDVSKLMSRGRQTDTFIREDINTLHYLDRKIDKTFSKSEVPIKKAHISTALANYAYLIESDYISYIAHNSLHICSSKNHKFQFYNQFDCYHQRDFLYFYMLTMQQLGLDPATQVVNLGGQVTADSPIFELLYAYIGKIDFRDSDIKMSLPTASQKQFYFDLYLCKSCV